MKVIRIVMAMVIVVCFASTAFASEMDAKTEKEVVEFVKKYRQEFEQRNIDAVMAMYAEDAVLMGTGSGERWVGPEEIRNAYLEIFKTFDKEESTLTWHKEGEKGDVVWVAGMTHVNGYVKNEKREFALNWTMVLVKQDGTWKFVQRHISNISCE